MRGFVRTSEGFINLDHVARISSRHSEKPWARTDSFYGIDGTCIASAKVDLDDDYGSYIPAAQDEHAVAIFGLYEKDGPIELLVEYPRIIAWSLAEYPTPIFADDTFNERDRGRLLFLVDFGGALRIPDTVAVKDLEGAKEFAKQYFEEQRSRESKASANGSGA
jgi:hypothetical protein